jgi:hypothetical protein
MIDIPFYKSVGDEREIFKAAWRQRRAVMLKGPTGVGKTRFVEFMAATIGRPLITLFMPRGFDFCGSRRPIPIEGRRDGMDGRSAHEGSKGGRYLLSG